MQSFGKWDRTVLESPFDERVGLPVVIITVFFSSAYLQFVCVHVHAYVMRAV